MKERKMGKAMIEISFADLLDQLNHTASEAISDIILETSPDENALGKQDFLEQRLWQCIKMWRIKTEDNKLPSFWQENYTKIVESLISIYFTHTTQVFDGTLTHTTIEETDWIAMKIAINYLIEGAKVIS